MGPGSTLRLEKCAWTAFSEGDSTQVKLELGTINNVLGAPEHGSMEFKDVFLEAPCSVRSPVLLQSGFLRCMGPGLATEPRLATEWPGSWTGPGVAVSVWPVLLRVCGLPGGTSLRSPSQAGHGS
jgi:hypothetical protein